MPLFPLQPFTIITVGNVMIQRETERDKKKIQRETKKRQQKTKKDNNQSNHNKKDNDSKGNNSAKTTRKQSRAKTNKSMPITKKRSANNKRIKEYETYENMQCSMKTTLSKFRPRPKTMDSGPSLSLF